MPKATKRPAELRCQTGPEENSINRLPAKSALFLHRLDQAFDPRHKLRVGQSAGIPFLGSILSLIAFVGKALRQVESFVKSTACTGLTIRSSHDWIITNHAQGPGLAQALALRINESAQFLKK